MKVKTKNVLHYGQARHLKTVMASYSNDRYEEVPFECDPKLTDAELANRLHRAVYERFPPSHFGGCGYSCSVTKVNRTAPNSGTVELMHYQGIGD